MANNKKLNKELRDQARGLGLCDQWYKEWKKDESKQDLIDKYLRGIDFCIQHDYPDLEFVKENFEDDLLRKNGIIVDSEANETNKRKVVLLGNSTGNVIYTDFFTGSVYVRHSSNVNIETSGTSVVFVHAYENCRVKVMAAEQSKVFVYHYSGDIQTEGNVVVREK